MAKIILPTLSAGFGCQFDIILSDTRLFEFVDVIRLPD